MKHRVRVILVLVIAYCLGGCQTDINLRHNTILSQKISESGQYKAVKFKRSLGATTADSFQLSIVKSNKNLRDEIGNVYISYEDFEYMWIEENTLKIINNGNQEYFKAEKQVDDVSVIYE